MEAADKALASSSDFNTWLDRMDEVYYAYKELTGYTPFNSKKIEMRSTRENLNDYFNMIDGENYYWVVYGYFDRTNIFKYGRAYYKSLMRRLENGDWGWLTIHEMGHVFDNDKWTFDSETLAQLKSYYIMEKLNAKIYDCNENEDVMWYTGEEYYNYLKYNRYNESYSNSFERGYYASEGFAALLIDIQREIGWDDFKKTFRYFSSLSLSQVPDTDGEILKLFLTKLKDYSGEDILGMINSRDTGIIEDWYGIDLEYVDPVYPSVSGGGSSGGGSSSEVNVDKGSYSTYQFTPTESANYYIYTSPYGGSGVSNDTYIEVYDNASLTGTPIASNDDYDGGRFSKVSVAMTEGATYYVKVRHYSSGQLHAELNITKNVPVTELTLDGHEDIITSSGEYALYKYTPAVTGTYIFEVTNYNSESTAYDTYLKLYENESMTKRIGNDDTKVVVNLSAGQPYYLQFSGYMMKYARGRINVRQGAVVEFSKATDRNFIYVNSPEYLTKYDIVDDETNTARSLNKIFEQGGITGQNTYFQTHLSWYGQGNNVEATYPENTFYLDVDFYNESDQSITVYISNLAYGVNYQIMGNYYTGGRSIELDLGPHEHKLLFETIGVTLPVSSIADRPTIMFDFTVSAESVMVSSLAAYDRSNLYLKTGTERTLLSNDKELQKGFPELGYKNTRLNEWDYIGKYKGTAWNQSAWIDADIEFLIDKNTQIGEEQPIYLKDDFYDNVANPKWSWITALNPIDDNSYGTLFAMPGALHSFRYPSDTDGKEWYFDFLHHDLTKTDKTGTGVSINTPVSDEAIAELRTIVAAGEKQKGHAIDEAAVSLGEWGTTYHYTITVTNTTDCDRSAIFRCRNFNSMTFGYKMADEENYQIQFHYGIEPGVNDWWEPIGYTVPANDTITFEVVTTLGVSFGGTNYQFVVR